MDLSFSSSTFTYCKFVAAGNERRWRYLSQHTATVLWGQLEDCVRLAINANENCVALSSHVSDRSSKRTKRILHCLRNFYYYFYFLSIMQKEHGQENLQLSMQYIGIR